MPVDFSKDPEFTAIAYAEPTPEALSALETWLSRNQSTLVRMYHGTRASFPVETQGLLPTTKTRRNSLQSRSGYVSLTIYPGMARTFAKMAFPRDEITVYAVDVPVNLLVPDKDQLRNQRAFAGRTVKDTLAHSIAYGHGAQVKGSIIPARITRTNESSSMPAQLNEYKYCSTQINLDGLVATRALMAGDMIPDDALGVEGREKQPHLTVQYGIETDDPAAVAAAVRSIRPFEITLGDTDAFPPSEHSSGDSPLFARVLTGESELVALRNAVRSAGPVHDSFPKYVPHMNIAYVKNDRVDALRGKDWLRGVTIRVSGVTFSNRDGTHTYLPFAVSESVVPQINSLLVRLGESRDDLSNYHDAEWFRRKFGRTSVEDHERMAADFKAQADRHRKDYESRTRVKAMGASKHANLRYYFDNSAEGKQYNALMAASRKHQKVAGLLAKSNRQFIDEAVEPENDMQRALFDYERSIAAQDAKTWARSMARKAFASAPVLSKNTGDTYYQKYLRDHAASVRLVKRLDRNGM